MNIWAGKGDKVRFAYPENGMAKESEKAMENLILGDIYIVEDVDVGQSRSYVRLKGHGRYNTVLFEDIDINMDKAKVREQFYPERCPWE